MSEWPRAADEATGISMAHPPDWAISEAGGAVAIAAIAPPDADAYTFRPNVNVVVEDSPDSGIDDHVAAAVAGMEEVLTDLRLLDYKEVELAGVPARKILAAYRLGVHAPTLLQWYALKEGRLVTVSATAETQSFNDMHETLERIAESVAIP